MFGESRIDHFHNGLDFAGEQVIYPIERGEVIFYRVEDSLSGFMGIGNHMVVEHQNRIRSFYYHLADQSVDKTLKSITKNDILASMGNTGKSFGKHLHLTIIDSNNRRVLNPQLLLPPLDDRTKPIIESLFFTIKERPNIYKIKNRSIINYKNNIKLYLVAGDIKPGFSSRNLNLLNARNVRRIIFKIDGQVINNFHFDYLSHRGNKLTLNNGLDFFDTYGLSFNYLLGEFFPSQTVHKFFIEVEDWAGNKDSKNYMVYFRL